LDVIDSDSDWFALMAPQLAIVEGAKIMRKHLNPFGKYHFDLNRMRRLSGEIP